MPYIEDAVAAVCQPGTVLDGELVDLAEPRQRKRTGSLLAASRQHKPTTTNPPLTYAIFDILCCGDTDLRDLPLHARLAALDSLFDSDVGRLHTAPFVEGRTEPALMVVEHRPSTVVYAESVIDAGGEGVVVKLRDSRYRHGAKNAGWFKFKPQQTVGTARIVTGDPRGALQAAQDGLTLDSYNEGLWRLAMQAEGRLGNRDSIGQRYQQLRNLLQDDLGLEPERATRALYHELLGQR